MSNVSDPSTGLLLLRFVVLDLKGLDLEVRSIVHRNVEGQRNRPDFLLCLGNISIRLQGYLGLQGDFLTALKLFNDPLHHLRRLVVLNFLRVRNLPA